MFPDLSQRRREPEWMDQPDADPRALSDSLRFIRRVNALFGYTRSTLSHLKEYSRDWKPGERIRILDVATGSGDVPRAVLRWSMRSGFDVSVVGVDLHPVILAQAAREGSGERFRVLRGDALGLPFADGSFDYAMTSMFLHHLDDDQVVRAIREMDRVARRGILVADLFRNRRAYAWIVALTVASHPMVRHDARVSVGQAFTREEVLALRDRAGVGYARFHEHFAHRFVLAGQKPDGANRRRQFGVSVEGSARA